MRFSSAVSAEGLSGCMMKKTLLTLILVVVSAIVSAAEIKFSYEASGHVFTVRQSVEFSLSGDSKGICRIYTYNRKKIFEKEMALPRKVSIPKLPNGYYFVEFTSFDGKSTVKSDFAVVPDPSNRKVSYEAPYSMDIALGGWKKIDEWVELTYLMGLKFVRERFHHALTEPEPGKYNWTVYGTAPRYFTAKGIHVSATSHNFASWAKNDPKMTLARDLFIPYRFAKKVSSEFKGKIQVWEFWNEPEIGFAKEGPWEYASMAKAAYLGFKAGVPDIPVANGAYTQLPKDNYYADMAFRNDLADYADIFNFHLYDPLCKYPEIIHAWKKILKDNGIEGQMIWITENGTNAEGLASVKPEKGNFWRHSQEQEMIWAEFIPKSQILLQYLGISRTFFFILRPINERSGRKEWGILRRDKSVKPGYVAFSTLLNELGSAKCLGEVNLGKDMRGFLYQQPDGSRTLAFWSVSELDTERTNNKAVSFKDLNEKSFEISGSSATVIDSFGTPNTYKDQNGKITIPSVRLTSYLRNAPAMEIKKAPQKAGSIGPRSRTMDRSVVLRILPSKEFRLSASRASMSINEQSKAKTIILQIYNFDDREKTAVITVQGGKLPGFPASIKLKPFALSEIKTSAQGMAAGKYTLVFSGSCEGLPISRLEFPLWINNAKHNKSIPVNDSSDPKKWRAHSSGKMDITFDEPEQSLRFDVDFSSKKNADKWAYPFFDCPKGLNGKALSFDIKVDVEGSGKFSYFMILNGDGKSRYIRYKPKNHQWSNITVEISDVGIAPQKLRSFQIGMNPNPLSHATWYIRNIRVIEK